MPADKSGVIRRRLNEHANAVSPDDLRGVGDAVTLTRISDAPVYLATLTTVYETRDVVERTKKYDGAGPRTPTITPANADPWRAEFDLSGEKLPDRTAEHALAGSEVTVTCTRCNTTGAVACSHCGGTGVAHVGDRKDAVCEKCHGGKTVPCSGCGGQKYTEIKYLAVRQSFRADERDGRVAPDEVPVATVAGIDPVKDADEVWTDVRPHLPAEFAGGPDCDALREWFREAIKGADAACGVSGPGRLGGFLRAVADAKKVVEPSCRVVRQTARVRRAEAVAFHYRYAGREYTGVLIGGEDRLHAPVTPATEVMAVHTRIKELSASRRSSRFLAWLDTAHHGVPLVLALLPFGFCLGGVPLGRVGYEMLGVESGFARLVSGFVLWGLLLSLVAAGLLSVWFRYRRDDTALDAHLTARNAATVARILELEGELSRYRDALAAPTVAAPKDAPLGTYRVVNDQPEVQAPEPVLRDGKPQMRVVDLLPGGAVVLAALLLIGVGSNFLGQTAYNRLHDDLSRAERLWAAGERKVAADVYRRVLAGPDLPPEQLASRRAAVSRLARQAERVAYSRLIEYEATEGDESAARHLLATAGEGQIELGVQGPGTVALLGRMEQEKEDEARRQREVALVAERERQRQREAERVRQEEQARREQEAKNLAETPGTRSLKGHKKRVYSVAFNSDGKTLASGDEDGMIKLWDVGSGRNTASLEGHTAGVRVRSLAFSPDGKTLASGGDDGTIKMWEVTTGKATATLRAGNMGGAIASVSAMAFSPDGSTLVTGGGAENRWVGEISLWDVATGRKTATMPGDYGVVLSLALSPNGKTAATGALKDTEIRLWDLEARKSRTLEKSPWRVDSIAFSPNGQMLAASSSGSSVGLWDASSGKHIADLTGHKSLVTSVVFSPDGKTLVSGSDDGTIRFWDVVTRKTYATIHTSVRSVAFAPGGETLASVGQGVEVWNLTKLDEFARNAPEPVAKVDPLPKDARKLAVTVNTKGENPNHPAAGAYFNKYLKSVTVHATENEIVIDCDVDTEKWPQRIVSFPLLVRVFDKDGEYLTHFVTGERFTGSEGSYEKFEEVKNRIKMNVPKSEWNKSPHVGWMQTMLLKPTGNRLNYDVARRLLKDAAMVEVGFVEP